MDDVVWLFGYECLAAAGTNSGEN